MLKRTITADIWIDGERVARSSAAARAVRLDAGVHELQIVFQQYAGAIHLAFSGGSEDAYPLPLRTGYLFPTQPEPICCCWWVLSTD